MKLRQICLVARQLDEAVDDLCSVLGVDVAYEDPGVAAFGLVNAVMPMGTQFLEVVSPTREETTAGRFLDRRGGDGGYMVLLQTADLEGDRKRLERHGVRVVWEITLDDIAAVHLHPRDIGGAIVSFDQPTPPESWRWGGPDWRSRSRTDVTRGIRGVELQSDDPAALAARWAAALAVPASEENGDWVIRLQDDGWIRFTPSIDDRGEGLTTVELVSADPDRALETARARGLAVHDGGVVTLCGTRFRLA